MWLRIFGRLDELTGEWLFHWSQLGPVPSGFELLLDVGVNKNIYTLPVDSPFSQTRRVNTETVIYERWCKQDVPRQVIEAALDAAIPDRHQVITGRISVKPTVPYMVP